ncbi:hypothetical protein pb186bvf_017217 [Paramecium bursaria]
MLPYFIILMLSIIVSSSIHDIQSNPCREFRSYNKQSQLPMILITYPQIN